MKPVNLAQVLSLHAENWHTLPVTHFNGHQVMLLKAKGEYGWHKHADTDEFFLVLKGTLVIEMRDASVRLGPGEVFVVPQGVEHRALASEEVHVMLIEPATITEDTLPISTPAC